MKISDISQQTHDEIQESASAGSTGAGSVAAVANPRPGKYGAPTAKQKKNKDGTAKNALDSKESLFGSKTIKR